MGCFEKDNINLKATKKVLCQQIKMLFYNDRNNYNETEIETINKLKLNIKYDDLYTVISLL